MLNLYVVSLPAIRMYGPSLIIRAITSPLSRGGCSQFGRRSRGWIVASGPRLHEVSQLPTVSRCWSPAPSDVSNRMRIDRAQARIRLLVSLRDLAPASRVYVGCG